MTHFHGGGAFYFLPIFSHHISHRTTAMLAAIILTLFAVSLTIIGFSLYRVSYSPNAVKKPAQEKLLEPGSGSDSPEKKRVKKKTQEETHIGGVDGKEKKKDLFPFTSSSSAIQRKISNQYDELVKSYESSGLNLAQVGKFVNCLVDAKKELQHRCSSKKVHHYKGFIAKGTDRSSFDRLHKQICKFELEKKRLDDDSFVYNWLQQQLKASPAYERILEIVATIEMTEKLGGREEDGNNGDDDFTNMSFEELLEQEKKDAFWQKHKKIRSN